MADQPPDEIPAWLLEAKESFSDMTDALDPLVRPPFPTSPTFRGHEIGRVLISLLCMMGAERAVGRPPRGALAQNVHRRNANQK